MDETEVLIGEIGLLLTQLNYSRHALEGIERATTKYAGIALSVGSGSSGTPLGSPPLTDGALRVYIVNISDLTAGDSIGDVVSGLIGGAGRFLGGFLGGFAGGIINPAASAVMFVELAQIVGTIDRIMARIGNPSGAAATAPGTGGATLSSQLDSVTLFVRELTKMFGAASGPESGGGSSPTSDFVKYFEPARMLAESVTRTVNGLIILLPMAIGALASLLTHLGEIEVAILGLLEFALRNVLLLRAAILATVLDTVAVLGGLAANVLGIVGVAVDAVLASVFRLLLAGLNTALTALQVASTGIKNVIDAMMLFLRDGVGALLIFIGNLRVFRLLVHLAQVLPLVLPAIARIVDRPLSKGETGALTTAGSMAPPGLGGTSASVAIAAFPDLAGLALPAASQAALRTATTDLGKALRTEVGNSFSAGQTALSGIAGTLHSTVGGLDANLGKELKARTGTATSDIAGLTTAMQQARDVASADLPDRGLGAIAKAYEGWLSTGGFATIMQRLNDHFRSLPTDATDGARTIPGRTVTAVLADRQDTRVVVEIGEVVIDLAPPDQTFDPHHPVVAGSGFDEESYLEWQWDRDSRGVPA